MQETIEDFDDAGYEQDELVNLIKNKLRPVALSAKAEAKTMCDAKTDADDSLDPDYAIVYAMFELLLEPRVSPEDVDTTWAEFLENALLECLFQWGGFHCLPRTPVHMTFGAAIEALKKGKRVARTGWNGKNMFLFLIQGSNDIAYLHGCGFGEYQGEPTFRDAIFMRTVDNQIVPWTASQTDCLAEDWQIVE